MKRMNMDANYSNTTRTINKEKKHMELTDLMIGDWVFIKDFPIKASPQKVRP